MNHRTPDELDLIAEVVATIVVCGAVWAVVGLIIWLS